MPKRSAHSASTRLTWELLRVGRSLDDKGAVGVPAMSTARKAYGRAGEPGDELRGDRAYLRKLQRGVPEGAVVDGDLDPLGALGLLDQRARAPDPGDDTPHPRVELEALEVAFDGLGVPGGDPGEDLVERLRPAHLLDLLQDHGRELPVALREHGIGPLGEDEEQRRPAPTGALRLADDQAVTLQVGEVLADGVGGHAEVAGDGFRARSAPAPKQLKDFHAGRTAGNHQALIRSPAATLAQAQKGKTIYYRRFLTKDARALNLVLGGDRRECP